MNELLQGEQTPQQGHRCNIFLCVPEAATLGCFSEAGVADAGVRCSTPSLVWYRVPKASR